tara:strand:- start:661 stop:1017 length:357 start_codon:yes stop_codon:yes gene_type:complete
MLKNVSKKPFKVSDQELSRALEKVYDDLNELAGKTNSTYETNQPAVRGDIKVVDSIFYYHTGLKWFPIDIAKINRMLFPAGGDGGEDAEEPIDDITPLQDQISLNKIRATFTFFWGAN